MNGTYGIIADQAFYCILAVIAFVVVAIAIRTINTKDKDGAE